MRPKPAITLDRNLQKNKTTALRNVKYGVILRAVVFPSENTFLHFLELQDMLFSLEHVMNCSARLADGSQ